MFEILKGLLDSKSHPLRVSPSQPVNVSNKPNLAFCVIVVVVFGVGEGWPWRRGWPCFVRVVRNIRYTSCENFLNLICVYITLGTVFRFNVIFMFAFNWHRSLFYPGSIFVHGQMLVCLSLKTVELILRYLQGHYLRLYLALGRAPSPKSVCENLVSV